MPTRILRRCSLILHSGLVVMHLALLCIWAKGFVHHLIVSPNDQKIVSFLITGIVTAIGAVCFVALGCADTSVNYLQIYAALLVTVAQTLSMRRGLQTDQFLTATHDNAAAWTGVGSSLWQLWNQRKTPSSIWGVLTAFLYLGNIMAFNVTTPSLFYLEAFNASRSVQIETKGLPAYNSSDTSVEDMWDYAGVSLYSLPSIANTENPGLHDGTLYEVLETNEGVGNSTVSATGFNITCGSLTTRDFDVKFSRKSGQWGTIPSTQPGVISMTNVTQHSIILYSTVPILDSNDNPGFFFNLTPPMSPAITQIQVFECFQTLVSQKVVIGSRSGNFMTAEPELQKTRSAWKPYGSTTDADSMISGNELLDSWGYWYGAIPNSDFPLNMPSLNGPYVYLTQLLNLHPANPDNIPATVPLYALENALSIVVATMFWTLGHIPPTHGPVTWAYHNKTMVSVLLNATNSTFLLKGYATVTEIMTQIHLEINIIAVTGGLLVSICLMLLSLPFSWQFGCGKNDRTDIPLDGTGILHIIWLYRNHPELDTLLGQAEHPNDDGLRRAGMVKTRLL
ncbi:hypothetical protein GGX14DRAFT_580122 [Mycena pura]|uniref:Uncharacterized protein n=1 Tax=Mycena pura TaxID=153505 RepID=A0AAD6Y1G4_9AGAR|nr:hypothetical protein GGX14DRAFT_580122 [Mycena pura]